MAVRVSIDREACAGTATCANNWPQAFAIDDEGVSIVINPMGATDDEFYEAAELCPLEAITITPDE